jgi:tetratricopeptide (TPR) repeat protein
MKAKIYLERGSAYKSQADGSSIMREKKAAYDQALDDFQEAYVLEPHNEEICKTVIGSSFSTLTSRATGYYLKQKDYAGAIADYEKAISLSASINPFLTAMGKNVLASIYRARDLGIDELPD